MPLSLFRDLEIKAKVTAKVKPPKKVIKIHIICHISGNTGPIFIKICTDVVNGERSLAGYN
jgi:hypothetical protein